MASRIALVLLLLAITVSPRTVSVPCLDDCVCEAGEPPLVRCENGDRTELSMPSKPIFGYEIIALPCNDVKALPALSMLLAGFPDLKAIDVEGNPNFNCSTLSEYEGHIGIQSDCGKEPFQCDMQDENCDWKCRALDQIKKLWRKFKNEISRKVKDIGGDEALQSMQDWFSKKFTELSRQFGSR